MDNDTEFSFFKASNVKFVIVVAYGQIIPERFLKIKNLLFLNIHASLLPRWRGAAQFKDQLLKWIKKLGFQMKIVKNLMLDPS